MALQFSRDTKVFLSGYGAVWEIPVLDGFSFSQATNASEITLSEMSDTAGNTRRARQMFNDSYAPAEWSFASYMRPNTTTLNGSHPAEDALWVSMFTNDATFSLSAWATATSVTSAADGSTFAISSASSNKATIGTFDLYFVLGAGQQTDNIYTSSASGTNIYKIEGCVPNEASIDFEVDGIATINWSGFGKIITEEATFNASTALRRGIDLTSNFVRNRLTSLTLTGATADGFSATYDLVLTGGNITINNNITFLTPETLGIVNQPLGHVTGTRQIGGNFTCYLGTQADSSSDLFEDLIENTSLVTNSFGMTFSVGGASAPKVVFAMPTCHLEVPTHSIEDVISLETNFHALPSDIDSANEITVTYTGGA